MKRVIRLLKTYISWPAESTEADQPTVPLAVNSDDIVENFRDSELNDLMPDIYAVKHDAVERKFEVIDQSSPDVDNSAGFNPYDTAILRKKFGPKPR
jgi:hypothetical protein